MGAKLCYLLILLVYLVLWICQQLACHLTHSLIILTDSYINVYKILEVSLGILHLQIREQYATQESINNKAQAKPILLFGRFCSYEFRRLPDMGAFFNRLFLAALLMLAAIEGIQTCFHVDHAQVDQLKFVLLLKEPYTYPVMLVGFASVGLIMQLCLGYAHRIRLKEIDLLESKQKQRKSELVELNPSFYLTNLENNNCQPSSNNSMDQVNLVKVRVDRAALVRHCISPIALITGALVVCFINNEFFTEISDAFLALSVVIIMFSALYAPMKQTATLLLQSVPDALNTDKIVQNVKSVSPLILEVNSLHLWSLALGGASVFTCNIVLDKNQIKSESQLAGLLANARREVSKHRITYITIQPTFLDPTATSIENDETGCSQV